MPTLALRALGAAEGLSPSYVGRVLRLAYLAPDIVTALVAGRGPVQITAQALRYRHDLPIDWPGQRAALGFPPR